MLRLNSKALVALALLAGPALGQGFTLPELGLQNSGTCRQLAARDRTSNAMVPLGCLDTSKRGWTLTPNNLQIQGSGSTGDVSGTSVTPNYGAAAGTLANTLSQTRRVVFLENFGGGAGVDNAHAFVAANNVCAILRGCTIQLKDGVRYPLASNVALGRNVGIRGATAFADPGNPFGLTTEFFSYLRSTGALVLGDSGSITFGSGGGMDGVFAVRANLKLDGTDLPASFTGTCFTTGTSSQGTDGVVSRNSAIIGCGTALSATGASRYRFENNLIDANNGLLLTNNADFGRMIGNHFYGVTQAGATGHETFSNRSGTAIGFYGTFVAGAYLSGNFAYAYQIGLDIQVPGQITSDGLWIDGTTTTDAQARPLIASTIGIRTGNGGYMEPQFTNLRICCQGTAVALGTSTAGAYQFDNVMMWVNAVSWNVSASNLQLANFSIRGYDSAFIFNSATAASTAKLVNGLLLDRNTNGTNPIDVNAGGGDPTILSVSRTGFPLDVQNESRTTVSPDGNGLITVPNGKSWVTVTGTQPIASIAPAFDGYVLTLEFAQSGNSFTGAGFLLSGSYSSTKAGANITLRFSRRLGQWVEVGRGPQ